MSNAAFHSLGATHSWVRFRGEVIAEYLGTAEVAPIPHHEPYITQAKNQLAGLQPGAVRLDDGEVAAVGMNLNRFRYDIWKRARDRVNHSADFTTHGVDHRLRRGTIITGVGDFQLILVNTFTGIAPFHPQALAEEPAGRIYYSVDVGPYDEDPSGSKAMNLALTFLCYSILNPTNMAWGLYSENPANFGQLGPIS